MAPQFIILGAGVSGLTTALELKNQFPSSNITIVAKHVPGDLHITYTSPWAGANWFSAATDNGRQEHWDAVTYKKFAELADLKPETGVSKMDLRVMFDSDKEHAGILTQGTGRVWYENLVGGLRDVPAAELPEGSVFGYEFSTFVINVATYLPWLYIQCLQKGVEVRRHFFSDIHEAFTLFPHAAAIFNCTGIGSYYLKGVEDHQLYPQRGQVILVEMLNPPSKMYLRSPARVTKDTTYVFPRGKHGGVILGGCRMDGVWDGEVDLEFSEDIKRRCCALCPELGKPGNLKVVQHGVGLRPARVGGAKVEREIISGRTVIHNYGAGGTGYQASWGMAKSAVELLPRERPISKF